MPSIKTDHRRLLGGLLVAFALLSGCVSQPKRPPPRACVPNKSIAPVVKYEPLNWSGLEGWSADRADEAWAAFTSSCNSLAKRAEWSAVCASARSQVAPNAAAARSFFEQQLVPYEIVAKDSCGQRSGEGLVTGYYEPLLHGSRTPTPQYRVPLYAPPDDLLTIDLGDLYADLKGRRLRGRLQGKKVIPYYSRAELERNSALAGKEIAWVEDAVDVFFLQIQGSGRVVLPTGETVRVGYADQNGHPYRAIGKYLVDQGIMTLEQVSSQNLRQWLHQNPQRMQQVLNSNPSFVFFREDIVADPSQGPKGAMGVALTPGRSIAVDPRYVPLGTPVFLSTTFPATSTPLQRLVVAQDTGGAINGAVRADFFWGLGNAAGESAGKMRQPGRMWLLWPKGTPPG